MAVDAIRFENFLSNSLSKSSLAKILIEYSKLKHQLENVEEQSWYFKQAISSHENQLNYLIDRFNSIRRAFDEHTKESLQAIINEKLEKLPKEPKHQMLMMRRILYSWLSNDIKYHSELLQLKERTNVLMPIDYYLEHPNEFLNIIEVEIKRG